MSLDFPARVRAACAARSAPEAPLTERVRATLEACAAEVYPGYQVEARVDGGRFVVGVGVEVAEAGGDPRQVLTPAALLSAGVEAEDGDGFVLTLHTFPPSPRPPIVAAIVATLGITPENDAAFLAEATRRVDAVLQSPRVETMAPPDEVRQFVDTLQAALALEVPEVADGRVAIVRVAWDPATRHGKVALASADPDLDPVGAVRGVRGQRLRPVLEKLRTSLDLVPVSPHPLRFLSDALHPGSASRWRMDEDARHVDLHDPTYVYQARELPTERERKDAYATNLRLAEALTGWTIRPVGDVDFIELGIDFS